MQQESEFVPSLGTHLLQLEFERSPSTRIGDSTLRIPWTPQTTTHAIVR